MLRPKNMNHYRREGTELSSLIEPTFALESQKTDRALYRQNGELVEGWREFKTYLGLKIWRISALCWHNFPIIKYKFPLNSVLCQLHNVHNILVKYRAHKHPTIFLNTADKSSGAGTSVSKFSFSKNSRGLKYRYFLWKLVWSFL